MRLQAERVVGWADLVTVHGVGGPGVLEGVQTAAKGKVREVGALLVAEMAVLGTWPGESILRDVWRWERPGQRWWQGSSASPG